MENPFTKGIKDPETGGWDGREIASRIKGGVAVLLSLAVLLGGGFLIASKVKDAWEQSRTVEDYGDPAGKADVTVTIPKGTSLSGIADILVQNDVVKTAKAFDRAVAGNSEAKKIQAGQYKLRTQIPAATALEMLLDSKRMVRNFFQVAEGLRLSEVLTSLSKGTKIKVKDFQAALKNRKDLELPAWVTGKSNEGFLFPDTYELAAKPTAANVLHQLVARFTDVTDELKFADTAKANTGYSAYQVLIVASIVEREVFRDEDRAKVARVFYNRLKQRMALQSDATVAYANNITGRIFTTPKERQINSPYNTYRFPGLPPGPITAPAKKALEAALNPAEGDWLYFMPINLDSGETAFATTLAEHNQNAQKLQQWCLASQANRDKCNGR